jgi:tRNA(Leu) C34 or U34 (ribose-2'-O)-methylase TrmL
MPSSFASFKPFLKEEASVMARIVDPPRARGFAAIGLFHPKDRNNVGSVLRAAWCYQASLVVTTGDRYRQASTDTFKTTRHLPLLQVDDLFDVVPFDCVPVAVDLLPGAIPLPEFNHPHRAYYIFGPEDGTLGAKITDRCRHAIVVPTRGCMNLAATVNVVLYDREAKRWPRRAETDAPLAALSMAG